MPEVSFALVGPPQTDVTILSQSPNIHLLGPQLHEDVPRYVKGFDVGIVPYRLSDYTASVYPTKLNEYLAMGIPVVATDLPEVRRFNAENGDIVVVAKDSEAFVKAVQEAVQDRSPTEIERRIEIACQNSWEARIAQMADLIQNELRFGQKAKEGWEYSLLSLYTTARYRTARIALGIMAAYFLIFHTSFVWFLAEPLRVAGPLMQADAIVVFAGGVGESGKAGGGYQERVKEAVDLYHDGKAPWLVFSSGYKFAFREAEMMRELAVAQGVPASAIILETKAANTFENVAFVREILRKQGWQQILLVTSPYHMRRALLTWRKLAPGVQLIPAPVPQSQFYAHGWGATMEQIRGIIHEYLAIVVYWWRGRI